MKPIELLLHNSSRFMKDVTEAVLQCLEGVSAERSRQLIQYHPITGGHMLRPLLVCLTYTSADQGKEPPAYEQLVSFAATVELIHNASLIHDDLLDDEDERRGKKSLNKAYGFKNALLCGNIFYIKAIELSNCHLGRVQTSDLLATAIKMCEGEIIQAEFEEQALPETIYLDIIRHKTASLTALACRQAAVLMNENEENVQLFSRLGEALGILYQLRDDGKDQDVHPVEGFDYQKARTDCIQQLEELSAQLSRDHKMKGFNEIIKYIKEN